MDNRAGEMLVFVRVVEAGSFSEAARLLHMTPSSVSKLISRMEERLNARLFERSTRRLLLTHEGRFYYQRSKELLAELDKLEFDLTRQGGEPQGVIRVNTSVSFGSWLLEPVLAAFWNEYPKIIIDLSLSDDIVDLYLDRTDIAFRVGKLPDSNLIARKIGTSRRVIVASPDYLAVCGTPQTSEDLEQHNCLGFNFQRKAPVWPMREGGRIVERMLNGSLLANNGETVARMAVAGVGLARLGDFHVRDYLKQGRLVEVLADSEISDSEEIHALYLGTSYMPTRIRVFLDFVVPRLQEQLKTG